MFKLTKRALIAAVVVAAASAPSAALAGVDLHLSQAQLAQLESYEQAVTQQLGPTPGGLAGPVVSERGASPRSVALMGIPARRGFQWDDAGIGAAGMLVLLGTGSAAVITRRRADQSRIS